MVIVDLKKNCYNKNIENSLTFRGKETWKKHF